MNLKKGICLLMFVFAIKNMEAQEIDPGFSIKGRVADSASSSPLSNITVRLYSDSITIVHAVITKQDGSFIFNALHGNKYFVSTEAVGYDSLLLPVQLNGKANIDLGILSLVRKPNQLKEVVVIGNRPLIRQEVDKIVYDLQADPESKSNSVLEMMRKVPYLSLDAEGNILLNGSRDFKIFINGKPSGMMDRAPKDVLSSIPASTIKSIEVITSPSSKYDAEGLAGIINIITHKKIDNGYNGSVNINYKSPVGGPGFGSSLSFKTGKFGISAFGGIGRNESPVTNNSFKRFSSGNNPSGLKQNISKLSNSRNAYFGTEISFEIDRLQLISGQINTNGYRQNGTINQGTVIYSPTDVSQAYNLDNEETGNGSGTDLGLNYQLGFKKSKEQLLTFSYRFTNQFNRQSNLIDIYNSFQYDSTDYSQKNAGSFDEHTAQIDYVHPFKNGMMETGVKSILRTNYCDYARYNLNDFTGKYEPVLTETNNYSNDQNVLAVYNSYRYNRKSWTLKAGVRVEQTFVDADFVSTSTKLKTQYTSVIPSFALSKKVNKSVNLNLTYGNRIRRPNIYQLNPFVDRSNPQFETSGNPDLKPQYSNVIQLAYNRSTKSTINISVGAMFFNKIIGTISTYDEATKITRSTYENMGDGRIFKTNMFISVPITAKWNFVLNTDLRHLRFSGQVDNEWVESQGFNAYVNITSGYKFEKSFRLNAGFTLNSGGFAGPQSTMNGYTSVNLSASKDFFNDKLNISASISDPFSKFRTSREELTGKDFSQLQETQIYYRSYSVSLNYRFGKLKEGVKKNRRGINNDDSN